MFYLLLLSYIKFIFKGETMYVHKIYILFLFTLSVKKEQWKCIVLPDMDNIWMLLWAFKLCTLTFLRTGNPIGLKRKWKKCIFLNQFSLSFSSLYLWFWEKIFCFVTCVYIFGQVFHIFKDVVLVFHGQKSWKLLAAMVHKSGEKIYAISVLF